MGVMLHEDQMGKFVFSLNVVNCPINATTVQNFNVVNLKKDDVVILSAPTLPAGLGIVNAYCLNSEVLTIRFANVTASPINPGVIPFAAFVFRAERILTAQVY